MWGAADAGKVVIMTQHDQQVTTADPAPRRPVRQLLAASVGNAVEWYDWFVYTGTRSV